MMRVSILCSRPWAHPPIPTPTEPRMALDAPLRGPGADAGASQQPVREIQLISVFNEKLYLAEHWMR